MRPERGVNLLGHPDKLAAVLNVLNNTFLCRMVDTKWFAIDPLQIGSNNCLSLVAIVSFHCCQRTLEWYRKDNPVHSFFPPADALWLSFCQNSKDRVIYHVVLNCAFVSLMVRTNK